MPVKQVQAHPVPPYGYRHLLYQTCFGDERIRMPDSDPLCAAETCGGQKSVPIQPGRLAGELSPSPDVIRLQYIFGVFAPGVTLGDALFKIKNGRSPRLRVRNLRQHEHFSDVFDEGRADTAHLLRVAKIELAIRQAEATLKQIRHIGGRVMQSRCHPKAQQIGGREGSVVQGVDVSADGLAECRGEFGIGLDLVDGGQGGCQRSDTARFDAGFVHVGPVVGDGAHGIGRGIARICLIEQFARQCSDFFIELSERPPAAAVWRDRRLFDPVAVGVLKEVFSGRHRRVDGVCVHARRHGFGAERYGHGNQYGGACLPSGVAPWRRSWGQFRAGSEKVECRAQKDSNSGHTNGSWGDCVMCVRV